MRLYLTMLLAALACLGGPASAATLIVDAGGKLTGASGVLVAGALYDVSFEDGACTELFAPCTTAAFAFQTPAAALAATQALVEQVFLDGPLGNFDSQPSLTRGCEGTAFCGAYVPFNVTVLPNTTPVGSAVASNGVLNDFFVDLDSLPDSFSTEELAFSTYAKFVLVQAAPPVPEPASWAMLLAGVGLVGASLRRRSAQPRTRPSAT